MKKKHFESTTLVAPVKQTLSGWDAMGMPVPAHRLQKGYKAILDILECDRGTAMDIARLCATFIRKDECAYIIGDTSISDVFARELGFNGNLKAADTLISQIDLIGRYRILAEMLTD